MKSKKNIRKSFAAIFFAGIMVLSVFAMMCTTASAATEDEIEQSIVDGLAWLAPQQLVDGSWNNNPGITGLVLLKFIDRAKELNKDPTGLDYEYSPNVIAGLAYLDSKLITVGVGAGYDGNNNGNMVNLGGTYYTGIATMAYSANPGTDPNLVQDLTDWLVNAQCTDNTMPQYGVWSYSGFSCSGDNSNTGYATMGLGFALNAGASIPDSTKTALSSYVDYIQNDPGALDDGTEDDPDGGSGYSFPTYWVNSLKTGNLIFEAKLSGDASDSARILNAVDYIDRHWNDNIEGWLGNNPPNPPPYYNTQYQATFTIMKGLESIGLEDLNGKDWFDEMSTVIVNDQVDDGSWTGCPAYVRPNGNPSSTQPDELCTAWALLTLEKVTPPPPSKEGRMTGGGSVFTDDGMRVTHGFTLHCDVSKEPNNLQVNWGKGNKFHLESLDRAFCSDDPTIDEAPPVAGFDTYKGAGTGRYNGVPGATAEWVFTDAGEPGKNNDYAYIRITDAGGDVVLTVFNTLNSGNQQAHED